MKTRTITAQVGYKKKSFGLPPKASIILDLAAGEKVKVSAQAAGGASALVGEYQPTTAIKETVRLDGFDTLVVESTQGTSLVPKILARQVGEFIDQRPPPERPKPSNQLAKIRESVRMTMKVQREQFLENDTGLKGYEIDDDDVFLEEEIAAGHMEVASDLRAAEAAAAAEDLDEPDDNSGDRRSNKRVSNRANNPDPGKTDDNDDD